MYWTCNCPVVLCVWACCNLAVQRNCPKKFTLSEYITLRKSYVAMPSNKSKYPHHSVRDNLTGHTNCIQKQKDSHLPLHMIHSICIAWLKQTSGWKKSNSWVFRWNMSGKDTSISYKLRLQWWKLQMQCRSYQTEESAKTTLGTTVYMARWSESQKWSDSCSPTNTLKALFSQEVSILIETSASAFLYANDFLHRV